MRNIVISLLLMPFVSFALTLDEAIEHLKQHNLEMKVAHYDVENAHKKKKLASAKYYGSLNFIQDVARSNDAGNVFGFKLTSREATFSDFGAREFMNSVGANGGAPPESAYTTPPHELNYPSERNFFQSKLKYEVPLYTGGQLSHYNNIMDAMTRLKTLEKEALLAEKVFELKKSFYNMWMIQNSMKKLLVIKNNILHLKETTQEMVNVGYAKHVDLLEIEAKLSDIKRILSDIASHESLLQAYISFLLNVKVEHVDVENLVMLEATHESINLNTINVVKKVQTAVEINSDKVGMSQASYYPKVGAFAEVATADDSFLGDAVDHSAYTAGARLTWNLFNGLSDQATVESAQIELLKRQTQLALAKEGVKLQIMKTELKIESDVKRVDALEKELNLLQTIRANYEQRYQEKLVSINDVIMKQSQELEKSLQLLQAINQKNENILMLEKIVGAVQ